MLALVDPKCTWSYDTGRKILRDRLKFTCACIERPKACMPPGYWGCLDKSSLKRHSDTRPSCCWHIQKTHKSQRGLLSCCMHPSLGCGYKEHKQKTHKSQRRFAMFLVLAVSRGVNASHARLIQLHIYASAALQALRGAPFVHSLSDNSALHLCCLTTSSSEHTRRIQLNICASCASSTLLQRCCDTPSTHRMLDTIAPACYACSAPFSRTMQTRMICASLSVM